MFLCKNINKNNSKGFLLIEMIVSVALFSVVMTIGLGSLLSIISANKRSQSFKIVVNNLNLAMETMSKDIRVGTDYNCGSFAGGDCVLGDDSFYFISKSGQNIIYRVNDNVIEKSIDGSGFIGITAPDIIIDNLQFFVLGSSSSDNLQPRVVIVIQAHAGERIKEKMEFGLQTTVSQRIID